MKKLHDYSVKLITYTLTFWLLYTIIYQFIDGWHYAPVSQTEKQLDEIVRWGWGIGLFGFLICAGGLVNKIYESKYYDALVDKKFCVSIQYTKKMETK